MQSNTSDDVNNTDAGMLNCYQ